jgi:feruloyl esterase
MSAQRYPSDFDGIVAGAPAYDPIYLPAWRMRLFMTVLRSPLYALPPEKLKLLNDAVLDKCDALNGVKDHFISDPRKCNFDPNVLKCNTASTASCLTPEQLETAHAAYSDLRSSTGEILFPGVPFAGELNWQLGPRKTAPGMLDVDTFRYLANQDPAWDWHSFDLQKDCRPSAASRERNFELLTQILRALNRAGESSCCITVGATEAQEAQFPLTAPFLTMTRC